MFHDLLRTVAGRWRVTDFVLPHFWGQQVVLGTQFLECQTKKAGSIWMPRWSSCWWTLPKNVFCDRELLCQVFAKMPCSCLLMPSAKGALPGTSASSSPSLGQLITTLTCTCVFWLPDKHVLQIKAVKCFTVQTGCDGDLGHLLGSSMCKQGIVQFLSNAEVAVVSCVKAAGPCKW